MVHWGAAVPKATTNAMKLATLFHFTQSSLFEAKMQQLHVVQLYSEGGPLSVSIHFPFLHFYGGVPNDSRSAEPCCMVT